LQIVDFRFQIQNPSTTALQSEIENLKSEICNRMGV
jgi:hypothetical protein